MAALGIHVEFPTILKNSVWHTTTLNRFESIITQGNILPEPNIPNSERWGTSQGESSYPYVRSIGGVSLFDFVNFDVNIYKGKYPSFVLSAFVPCKPESNGSIWIEIDIAEVTGQYIAGAPLLKMWKESGELRRKLMPEIEAAHIGPISKSAFKKVLKYQKDTNTFSVYGPNK